MKKEVLREQIDFVIAAERAWKDHFDKQDHGSYCENASHESKRACKVLWAFRDLLEKLTEYERE